MVPHVRIPAALALLSLSFACGTSASRSQGDAPAPTREAEDAAARPPSPVSARLLANVSHIAPGQEVILGVELAVEEGWYVHWKHAGEGGAPTRVRLRTPEGFAPRGARFPGPTRFDAEDGGARYGYRRRAMVSIPVVAPDQLETSAVELAAEAEWMACRERGTCTQGRAAPRIELPVATPEAPSQPAHAERFEAHRRRLPAELSDVEGVRTSWQRAGKERAELSIDMPGATELEFFPEGDIGLVGQVVTPEDNGKTLRIWLDPSRGQRARGAIRMIRDDEIRYLSVSLDMPAESDLE